MMQQVLFVTIYLLAIIVANLSVAAFGPASIIINAFLFIGLDLSARDGLHEAWRGKHLFWKTVALVSAGSIISYVLNRDAGRIALASFVAFAAAGAMDTISYQLLKDRTWMVKSNGSNLVAAAVDSLIFPTIAFGAFSPLLVLGQFIAKVAGGFIWSAIISNFRNHSPILVQNVTRKG